MSYSWDSPEHKAWTKALGGKLRGDGVDVALDQWQTVPGDRLPHYMEKSIRDNDFVLIICTPSYKMKSDARTGGAGYEGDVMTGEVWAGQDHRKFVPVLRAGAPQSALPSWLAGKYYVDLRGEPYSHESYLDLLTTLHGQREVPPPIGRAPNLRASGSVATFGPPREDPAMAFEPVAIKGVIADEVSEPRNDGTRGCALYTIPIRLSRAPSAEWGRFFREAWDRPPQFTTMHRPGIARVDRDRIVLAGTTIEELRDVHRDTLKLAVQIANEQTAKVVQKLRSQAERDENERKRRRDNIKGISDDLDFE